MWQQIEYWREVRRRTGEKTQLLQPWRLYSGVGSAVLSPLVQLKVGRVSLPSAAATLVVVGLVVYFSLTFGEYAYKALCMVPAEMWRENRSSIENLERERRKMASSSWPSTLKAETQQNLVVRLEGSAGTFQIFHNPLSNCADFALALDDALRAAGWQGRWLRPVVSKVPVRPGVMLSGDQRAVTLAAALKDILDIEARIEKSDSAEIQIEIGVRGGGSL
jgi:hypothetical protein